MSDKLLKDGLRTSDRIGGVSIFAEHLFIRLILATCPLGRCPWSPDWILEHALPNRPRTRLQAIADALESLRSAHLINRYLGPDGTAFLTIPRHGQRFKHAVRSPWPAPPPGPADAEGQAYMAFADPPDPPALNPEEEEKRRGKRASRATPAPPMPPACPEAVATSAAATASRVSAHRPPADESDAAWLARLRQEWPRVDLDAELAKAHRKRRGDVERTWFERVWLPGVSPLAPLPGRAPAPAADKLPADWREAAKIVAHATTDPELRERRLDAAQYGDPRTLGPEFRRLIEAELHRRRPAA